MKKKKWLIIASIVILLLLGAYAGIRVVMNKIESNLEGLADEPLAEIDLTSIKDGVHAGSYSTFPVSAEVEVTVKDHRISAIKVIEHKHGPGYSAESITGSIIESQGLQVDVISGATYSSMVILKAVEAALLGE